MSRTFVCIFGLLVVGLLALGSVAPAAAQEAPAERPLASAVQFLGWPHDGPLEGERLEFRTQEVSSLLRCSVCQGLSVADSTSSAARHMKELVRDLLALGYDDDQVLSYFERSHGELVRPKPPLRGMGWLVWLAPLAGLAAGSALVARALRSTPPAEGR